MNDYDELCAWTLGHGGAEFFHQHVVDVWQAQQADAETKPIGITMALVGLYLHVEHGWTGRDVQKAHMKLARTKRAWPTFELPATRGELGPKDVLSAGDRKRAIDAWCAGVWQAYAPANRAQVETLLRSDGITP